MRILALTLAIAVYYAGDVLAFPPAVEESITVKVVGTLKTGIVAIGGETTGTTITAKGITWELDLGRKNALQQAARKLNGKKVVVEGGLRRKAGVEVKVRWIVTVTALRGMEKGGVQRKTAFRADAGRNGTRIRLIPQGDKLVIDVACPFGIDKATIERLDGQWPRHVIVRLHLKGLESFRAVNGDATLRAEVSSTDDSRRVSLSEGNRTAISVDETSPWRTDIRMEQDKEKTQRRYDVHLPPKFFAENPPRIQLSWVDFFRG